MMGFNEMIRIRSDKYVRVCSLSANERDTL